MAKPVKRKVPGGQTTSGRVTPKGGSASARSTTARSTTDADRARPTASTRYTPPAPARLKMSQSGRLVPGIMFTLLGAGVLMIIINYMSVLLPGAPSNWYIVGGLGLILSGIMVATQWR
jgi:hypothetical protein